MQLSTGGAAPGAFDICLIILVSFLFLGLTNNNSYRSPLGRRRWFALLSVTDIDALSLGRHSNIAQNKAMPFRPEGVNVLSFIVALAYYSQFDVLSN